MRPARDKIPRFCQEKVCARPLRLLHDHTSQLPTAANPHASSLLSPSVGVCTWATGHDLSSPGGVCLQHPPTSLESRLLRKASGTTSRHTARVCLATLQRTALDYLSDHDYTFASAGCMSVLPSSCCLDRLGRRSTGVTRLIGRLRAPS